MNKTYLKTWQKLLDVDKPAEALCDHFRYLIEKDVSGFEPLLRAVMEQVVSIQIKDDMLLLQFPDGEFLEASPPCSDAEEKYAGWPESFRRFIEVHEFLEMEEAELILGDHGGYDGYWTKKLPWDHGEIKSPAADYSDIWIYHPEEKNPMNEPVIYFLSHEDLEISNAKYYSAGGLFLVQMANWLELEVKTPSGIDDLTVKSWWNELDNAWKKMIEAATNASGFEAAEAMLAQKSLTVNEDNGIDSLAPVRFLKRLETFKYEGKGLKDISPLVHLTNLRQIDLSDSDIVDIKPLEKLQHLASLNVSRSGVEDITPISTLKTLKYLKLSGIKIADLTPLYSLKKLMTLWISGTNVKSLEPLLKLNKNLDVVCYETPVPFHEVLRIAQHRLSDKVLAFSGTVYSDYNRTTENFIRAVENIDSPLDGVEDALAKYTNDHLVKAMRSEDKKHLVPKLLSAYLDLPPREPSGKWVEELAENTLRSLETTGLDSGMEQAIIERIVPQDITLSQLAFRLACYYAGKGKKDVMLNYATKALELGYERARFESDSNFDAYRQDPDFLDIIQHLGMPDPGMDPVAWFNSLTEEMKDSLELQDIEEVSEEEIRSVIEGEDFSVFLEFPESLDYLRNLKSLKRLFINFSMAQSLEVLATLKGLELFECNFTSFVSKIKYDDLSPLSGLRHLRVLNFENHTVEDISPLANITSLEEINLLGNPIRSLEPVQSLVHLKKLCCSLGNALQTAVFKPLTGLLSLQLHMEENSIDSFEGITFLENLEMLTIRGARAASGEVLSVKPLSKLKQLRELQLLDTPITDLETLFSATALKNLIIDEQHVNDALKKSFEENLPQCSLEGW